MSRPCMGINVNINHDSWDACVDYDAEIRRLAIHNNLLDQVTDKSLAVVKAVIVRSLKKQ